MQFYKMIEDGWTQKDTLVCVGLDPDLEKVPEHLKTAQYPIFEFNKALIDVTADLVCAYKPQFAHYAAQSAESQLKMTIDYIHEHYPGIPVILDAKRGDIANHDTVFIC